MRSSLVNVCVSYYPEMPPDPSIERRPNRQLRCLSVAAHVKRWARPPPLPCSMRHLHFAIVFLALQATCAPALSEELPGVVPPTEQVEGYSQEDWSRLWWQWAASFDDADSPVADRMGDKCHLKQSGPVWFLAGTYGTRRTIRSCTLPRGKHIFFPLINYVVYPRHRADRPSCGGVAQMAKQATDGVNSLVLELNGIQTTNLGSYRQATSSCFNLGARADPPADLFPSAANGYYVMLRPLPPGRYELNFGGALPGLLQAVTYRLVVE